VGGGVVSVFKVGDFVTWTSQSGSYRKTKIGEVVEVVPPRVKPNVRGCGSSRNHESYVVRVREMFANGRVRSSLVYWPRVSHLSLLGAK
jgi:hypothetical protein